MYFTITQNDGAGLKPEAVLLFRNEKQKLIPTVDVPERAITIEKPRPGTESELIYTLSAALEEADNAKACRLSIPISEAAYGLHTDHITNCFENFINKEAVNFSLDILLKPHKHTMRQIILATQDTILNQALHRKLTRKSSWSKARKFSFVLDCLDLELDRESICKRHFIHQSSLKQYLQNFSKDCKAELLERLSNIHAEKYGKEVLAIINDKDQLRTLVTTIRSAHRSGFISDEYSTDLQLSKLIRTLDDLLIALDHLGQLFPYIVHLVPDQNFMGTHSKRKWSSKGSRQTRKNKRDRLTAVDLREEIGKVYAYLLKRIQRTQMLKGSVFPVSKLQDFWTSDSWGLISSENAPAHEISLELLSNHYDLGIERLTQIIYDSKRHG
jgi:hypothetical protein